MTGWTSTPSAGCSPTRGSGCWPRPTERGRRLPVGAGRPAAYGEPGARRRRDHPGASCGSGRRRSSATSRSGCTSRPKASSRPPACRSPTHRAARLRAAGDRDPDRPRLRHRRRPGRLRPGRDHLCRRRPRPGAGRGRRGQPRGAGPRRCGDRRGRHHGRHLPLRRGVRRPGAPVRARAQLRRRRLDPALVLRADAAEPRLLREGRPRHPARPRARTAWRPSGSATTARSRRPCSGRAASPPPAAAPPCIGDGGLATLTDEDDPGAGTGPLAAFLYEPDGAVIRAGLVTAVAAGVGGHLLDEHIAYVTAEKAFRTPVRPGLPGARGGAVPREAAARPPCASAGSAG